MKIFFKYLLPLTWMIFIFILSSIPGENYPEQVFNYSFLAHFVEFFILSILVLQAVKLITSTWDKNIILSLIFCVLFALSDEIHQIFVANRSASLLDWLVDLFAILVGIKFYIYLLSLKLQTKYPTPNGPS